MNKSPLKTTCTRTKRFQGGFFHHQTLEVESPGKLPGLVKVGNIRHTHFSRNPKIAEFLRDYNFVKEYGEGVDRMCRELEAVGLQSPEYRLNAFMLQATIRNHLSLEKNHGLVNEKSVIEEENRGLKKKTTVQSMKNL